MCDAAKLQQRLIGSAGDGFQPILVSEYDVMFIPNLSMLNLYRSCVSTGTAEIYFKSHSNFPFKYRAVLIHIVKSIPKMCVYLFSVNDLE